MKTLLPIATLIILIYAIALQRCTESVTASVRTYAITGTYADIQQNTMQTFVQLRVPQQPKKTPITERSRLRSRDTVQRFARSLPDLAPTH